MSAYKKDIEIFKQHNNRNDNQSDNADDLFSVEEEKTNGSRTGEFFETKKNQMIVLKQSMIESGRFMIGDKESSSDSDSDFSISDLDHSREKYKAEDFDNSFEEKQKEFTQSVVSDVQGKHNKIEKINLEHQKIQSYTKNLTKHIDNLDEATRNKNPAKFQMAFNGFKNFVVDNWT